MRYKTLEEYNKRISELRKSKDTIFDRMVSSSGFSEARLTFLDPKKYNEEIEELEKEKIALRMRMGKSTPLDAQVNRYRVI